MELDDQLPDVWTAKSDFLFQYEWDAKEAERCLRRAIELNPSYADAYAYYSYTCCAMGRYEEAIQLSLKEKTLDPYPARPLHLANLSQAYALAGKQEDALREIDRMQEMYPNNPDVRLFRAQTYGLLGIPEKAVAELEQLRAETKTLREKGTKGWTAGVPPGFLAMNMFSYAAVGRDDRIKEMIEEAEDASRTEHVSPSTLGFLYLAAAELEKALEAFEGSLKDRDPGLFMYSHLYLRLMKQVPSLSDSVTSDRRFVSLLQKVGVRLMT